MYVWVLLAFFLISSCGEDIKIPLIARKSQTVLSASQSPMVYKLPNTSSRSQARDEEPETPIFDFYLRTKDLPLNPPPHYCNPIKFPPNIIFTAAGCRPYLNEPWMKHGLLIRRWPIF